MKLLELNDLELIELIGAGDTGKVYLAKDKQGKKFAVKVFDGMTIHRGLLAKALNRLSDGEWPAGILNLEKLDLDHKPAFSVMPFLGDEEMVDGKGRLWNLQHRLDSHPGDDTWNLIRDIADGMAEMHRRRVVHGNLKPGNVFFDESGKVQLTDWMLGNMPEVSRFGFTDALLYQSPEQLLDPAGYHDEKGYKWDVFAFGVLAYRLLTRRFPRCEEIFRDVAPKVGEDCDTSIHAELPKIARGLFKEPEITWPFETGHVLERTYRAWIEECLRMNPAERPSSMIEVSKAFYDADAEYTESLAREELVEQIRHSERGRRIAWLGAGIAAAMVLIFSGLWMIGLNRLNSVKDEALTEKRGFEADLKEAREQKSLAEDQMRLAQEAERKAQDEVKGAVALGLERLKVMNQISDRLFAWGMEKGHRTLPVLDGRQVRLKQLEDFYQEFLETHRGNQGLNDEIATARLHLAEISIALGNAEQAQERLEVAIRGFSREATDPALLPRMARNMLLLTLLKQRLGREDLDKDFTQARQALQGVAGSAVDVDQIRHWQAILDFHEARWLMDQGDEAKALEQLKRSIRDLNDLAAARPDAAVVRSELASSYLSTATVLEGLGNLLEAHETRLAAADEIQKLLKSDPDDPELLLELAACYGALAEASQLAGDVSVASKFSADAMDLLDRVLKQQPESSEANTRKGTQLGIQAGLLRDQGKSSEAMKALDDGIAILERQEKHSMRDYRMAMLQWQKGRMLGYSGKKEEELDLLIQADLALKNFKFDDAGPKPEVLKRSRAYLLGDLAHALEMAKQNARAEEIYHEAMGVWEALLKLRPDNEEYRSALEWSRQRVSKL